jgi:hypothetical protein
MYSVGDIERLLGRVQKCGLEAPAEMLSANADELIAVCNGAGCEHEEHIAHGTKKALCRVMAFAECSAAIHDWCYAHSDGTEDGRKKADKLFRKNMLDEIEGRKVRFKWLRQWIALRAYEAVRKYGRSDWCIAFAESQTKGK